MRVVSVQEMREMDRATIEDHGIDGYLLMDRAGRGVADAVCDYARMMCTKPVVLLIAGKGNNGGDVYAAARYLVRRGYSVTVRLVCRIEDLKGDAAAHFEDMDNEGVHWVELPSVETWENLCVLDEEYGIVVDGLLGTGASGAPRGAVGAAIEYINRMKKRAYVVAIDIPSGINGDTGVAEGSAVCVDVTVTMAVPKKGFMESRSHAYIGRLDVVDIGIPEELYEEEKNADQVVSSRDVNASLPTRNCGDHKGTFGRVLLIGGARGFSGAVRMAGMAAVRSGCGLVSALVPAEMTDVVSASCPEMMVTPCLSNDSGGISSQDATSFDPFLDVCDAVMIGPGMTPSEDTRKIVDYVIQKIEKPVLLDADALNVFANDVASLKSCSAQLVLTPHPGEMGRLLGISTAQVQQDRRAAVTRASRESDAVVVLKGAGTLIASESFGVSLNLTGNPGMARGGSGDVLAGLLAGLLAQGIEPYHAACSAVYLHGLAGDYAAMQEAVMTMTPTDLIACLSRAVQGCVKCKV